VHEQRARALPSVACDLFPFLVNAMVTKRRSDCGNSDFPQSNSSAVRERSRHMTGKERRVDEYTLTAHALARWYNSQWLQRSSPW